MADNVPPEDVFTILIATDTHLGHKEDDPIRGDDSFIAFEEVLQIGRDNDVDFILLGGDLFDVTKPSPICLHRCMTLLREYCMGDRPISIEFVSDPEKNFEHTSQNVVNYEDPNLNVSIPVFSIHGNHDDPTGQQLLSSLDIMSCAGLVNYIGKVVELSEVHVNPVLLRKGESLLAIYGLSHIADKRLCRLFQAEKVKFYQPEEDQDDWFNILVLHQNRANNRGEKNFIEETVLPNMLDLVVWGHEHDCRIKPEFNPNKNFHVMQPGSSVATSLSESESIKKKVAIVKIYKKDFSCTPISLKTVRPFIFRDACTSEMDFDEDDARPKIEQIEERASQIVLEMIEEAESKLTGHPKQPKLPLIRLILYYADESELFNRIRFGQLFDGKVANPDDILLLKKRSIEKKEKRDVLEGDAMERILGFTNLDDRIEDYVKSYFEEREQEGDDKYRLNVLTVSALNEAVKRMVDKQDTTALAETVRYQKACMAKHLIEKNVDEDTIFDEMTNFYNQRVRRDDAAEIRTQLESANRVIGKPKTAVNGNSRINGRSSVTAEDYVEEVVQDEDEIEEEFEEPAVPASRGRGRGRGSRGGAGTPARAPRAARGSRARAASSTASSSAATRARGRARGATQQTLQQSLANASQISVVRTSGRSTANRSRMQFVDSDDSD